MRKKEVRPRPRNTKPKEEKGEEANRDRYRYAGAGSSCRDGPSEPPFATVQLSETTGPTESTTQEDKICANRHRTYKTQYVESLQQGQQAHDHGGRQCKVINSAAA